MALPVTIDSTNNPEPGDQNSYVGPFKSSGGAFYTILWVLISTVRYAVAYKATDPTSSFTEQDTSNRPVLEHTAKSFNVRQDSDDLHVSWQNQNDDVFYARFAMSSDTWDAIDGASDRDILIDGAPNGTADACDLVVRSDGDIAVVYQKETEKVMGNPYERVGLSVSTSANRGETWSAVVRVDNQGSVERDMTGPRIVLPPANSDQCHIFFIDTNDIRQRALDSTDTLRTERDTTFNTNTSYGLSHGVGFSRSSTSKVRIIYREAVGNDPEMLAFDAFPDDTNPTFSTQEIDTAGVQIDNLSIDACAAVDGSTVHALVVRASDDDLYTANDQDTDTWTAPAGATRGTGTKNHVSCKVYDRSGTKLARIEDDGGTVKYDEDVLAAGDTTISVPQDSLSETDNVPGINTGVTVSAPQDSLTETDNVPEINIGVKVSVPQDSLTETDNAPTVPQIVGVPQDSLSQTDNVPDIRTGVTVGVSADALAQVDNVPGINTGVTVASPQDSLSQTDNAPTVPQIVGVPADSQSQADNAPDIRTGVNVAVPQDALSQTDNVPVIQTSIAVPQDSLAQTDNVPTIGSGIQIDVPQDSLTQTDNIPVLNTGVNVEAPQDSLAQNDNVPLASTGVMILVPADALSVVDNAPDIMTSTRVNVPADALSIADQAPGVATGVKVALPANDNLTLSTFAPVITATAGAPATRILRQNPMIVTVGKMMNR